MTKQITLQSFMDDSFADGEEFDVLQTNLITKTEFIVTCKENRFWRFYVDIPSTENNDLEDSWDRDSKVEEVFPTIVEVSKFLTKEERDEYE